MESYGKSQNEHYDTDAVVESPIEKFFNHLYHLGFSLLLFLFACNRFLNVNYFWREIWNSFCFVAVTEEKKLFYEIGQTPSVWWACTHSIIQTKRIKKLSQIHQNIPKIVYLFTIVLFS